MPKIVGSEELVTIQDCQQKKSECYKFNIKPIMDKLDKFEHKLEEQTTKINKVYTELSSLPEKLTLELDKRYAQKDTVDDIRENIKWVVRIIVGTVIAALLALIIIK